MNLPWDSKNRVDKHDGGYHRKQSDPRYQTARWRRLSKRWRDAHPLCEECKRNGIIKPADCVDHIIPIAMCDDFYDETNLQSLCNECNMKKGFEDSKKIEQWRQAKQKD